MAQFNTKIDEFFFSWKLADTCGNRLRKGGNTRDGGKGDPGDRGTLEIA